MKEHKLADIIRMKTERIRNIFHEFLDMQQLIARWVPRLIKIHQKEQMLVIPRAI